MGERISNLQSLLKGSCTIKFSTTTLIYHQERKPCLLGNEFSFSSLIRGNIISLEHLSRDLVSLPSLLYIMFCTCVFYTFLNSWTPKCPKWRHINRLPWNSLNRDGLISKEEMMAYFLRAKSQLQCKMGPGFIHNFHEMTYLKPTFCEHCAGFVSMFLALSCFTYRLSQTQDMMN